MYPAQSDSKVTDSFMENSETSGWIDFASIFKYINNNTFEVLMAKNEAIGKRLHHMIINPDKY